MDYLMRMAWPIRDRLFLETGLFFPPAMIIDAMNLAGLSTSGAISYARRIVNAGESTLLLRNMLDVMSEVQHG